MTKKKRPSDINILAKQTVDEATRKGLPVEPKPIKEKSPAAVALGTLGGLKGGKARAEKLSPEKRKETAQKAAQKRWSKKAQP
jgi:hypothetical protein